MPELQTIFIKSMMACAQQSHVRTPIQTSQRSENKLAAVAQARCFCFYLFQIAHHRTPLALSIVANTQLTISIVDSSNNHKTIERLQSNGTFEYCLLFPHRRNAGKID